ncbi:hypothetical protein AFK68_22670 [Hydrocoleum sp. CS-953]|uniref:hypothetical protein n=1 Tax=Hydrocoleum sp. CS-953 TaxID=1671698 RepID=UPI000B9AD834|nr:hypothetical protein [Hydrocoleum sp. CS-953]OZH52694.1 hypothetical protein AFK68_22670 [Hydrocoleum sp. CS-953]
MKQQQSINDAIKQSQSDHTDDARIQARKDAIEWGIAYKKYLTDYKEEARMIIQEKILKEKDEKLESLDLDESMFFPGLPSAPHIG